jgi:DNA polymerase III subunit epsilon
MKAPRLSINLVPVSTWQKNVRAVVSRSTWDVLRWFFGATSQKPLFVSTHYNKLYLQKMFGGDNEVACAICSSRTHDLQLHEEWSYDDSRKIQRLVGLIPLCRKCHLCKHLGFANERGRLGVALTHLAKVNEWSIEQAWKYSDGAFLKWRKRSGVKYEIDLRFLGTLLDASQIHIEWLSKQRGWVGDRQEAIRWAADLLNSDALILDTETTGLLDDPDVEVVELAVLNMRGKLLYQSRFRPGQSIPNRVVSIHKISDQDVLQSPRFADEWKTLSPLFEGRTLVCYKAKFDRGVIENTCRINGLGPPECVWECAMWPYYYYLGSPRLPSLPGKAHRALADARATLGLVRRMARSNF